MLRMNKRVDMSMNTATKMIYDSAMKEFYDLKFPIADEIKDVDEYLELERT